jgi:hypothetical protein
MNRRNSFTSSSTSTTPNNYSSSSSNSSSATATVNPKGVSFPPGTHVIPPPFSTPSNFVKAPFPAFLPDGQTYVFETDPAAFGIYSRHLRHGDTAKISLGVNSRTGEETFMSGIVIGVAGDGNLYWWKFSEAAAPFQNSSPMMMSNSSTLQLDSFATFLAPRIPFNAEQQANKVMVMKQSPCVMTMDPLNFHQQQQMNSPSNSYQSHSPYSSATSTPSHYQQQQQQQSSNVILSEEEFFELETEKRNKILQVYSSWLGEAIWCFNLPIYSNSDAVRFSRVL